MADKWMADGEDGFAPSVIVEQDLPLFKRSIHKTVIKERASSELIKQDENYYLYDLGREEVGYLTFKVTSDRKQKLTICFGEHPHPSPRTSFLRRRQESSTWLSPEQRKGSISAPP